MTLASTLCLFALAGASTAAGAHAARTWEKVLLSDAVAKGAVCLGASPASTAGASSGATAGTS